MYRTVSAVCELTEPLARTQLGAVTFSGDEYGLCVRVRVTENGVDAPLNGAVPGAWMLREDGTTLRFPGEIASGYCEALLPPEACAVLGRFSLLLRLTDGNGSRTIFWGEGQVLPSVTDEILTAGTPLPNLDTLLARLSDLEAAITRANAAATAAQTAADSWQAELSGAVDGLRDEIEKALAAKADTVEEGNRAWLWEQGAVSASTGKSLPDTYAGHAKRVRTAISLPISRMIGIQPRPGAMWTAFVYDSGLHYLGPWPANPTGYISRGSLKREWLADYPEAAYLRIVREDAADPDSEITPAEVWDGISILLEKQPMPDPALWEEVPVGAVVQGRRQPNTREYEEGAEDVYYPYRVTQESVTALPQGEDTELYWVLTPWMNVSWRLGAIPNALNTTSGWLNGGEPVRVAEGMSYFRAAFARLSDDYRRAALPLAPGDEAGCRLFVRRMPTAAESDPDALRLLDSLRRKGGDLNAAPLPVIAHTSDVHGDEARLERFAAFCDEADIDLAAVTGDICGRAPAQGFSFCHGVISRHVTPMALCVGNHDVNEAGMTDAAVYQALMAPVAAQIGNAAGKTWYMTDLPEHSLRLISLNTFQCGAGALMKNHLSSEQLQWFCGALADTPAGWGILVLQHSPFGAALEAEAGADTFFGRQTVGETQASEQTGTPVWDIVDAFIGRERIVKSWRQGGDEPVLSVSADFGGCGGEFIAHLVGHLHVDAVCPVPGTRFRQLLLGVTCCTPVRGPAAYPYLSNADDLGRRPASPSQDAFNLYVIDRDSREVTVLRAGQHFDRELRERRVMRIAYGGGSD
ncbi:MAG: metallophosphoesterase [Clostridia bacterium]|nr:metallophosphoesterase [Clostridia bacterium]